MLLGLRQHLYEAFAEQNEDIGIIIKEASSQSQLQSDVTALLPVHVATVRLEI